MEIPERIWHLMAKALNKEASAVEMEELSSLLQQDESIQQQFDLLTRIWQEKGQGMDDEGNARKLILKIIDRAETESGTPREIEARRSRRRRSRQLVLSFSIIFLAAIVWWLFIQKDGPAGDSKNKSPEALVVNKGSRSRFLLTDGTTVWLNAGSKLFYVNDFGAGTREVRLEGEAFFDVVRDAGKPFIVHTSDIDIRVLGTSFNVKSYPEDKNVETTLYHGMVQVVRRNAPERTVIRLKPNEKLVLPKEAAIEAKNLSEELIPASKITPASFTITKIDSTKKESERLETAWLYSRLEFRGDSFEELALKLERWYNVSIKFTDEEVKKLNVNGSFEKETVEQAMAALKQGFPISYKINNNNEIYIGSSR